MAVAPNIRLAFSADSSELARLRWDFRSEEQSGHSRFEFCARFEAWFGAVLDSDRWIVVVAESSPAALVGCMFLQCIGKVPSPGEENRVWGYVTNCYVDAPHRNRGLGTRMLKLLIDCARARKLDFLIVWPSGGPLKGTNGPQEGTKST